MEEVKFREDKPAHERYGYGALRPLETACIDVRDLSPKEVCRIRGGIFSHGKYHNKKFKTKTKKGFIHIKRVI